MGPKLVGSVMDWEEQSRPLGTDTPETANRQWRFETPTHFSNGASMTLPERHSEERETFLLKLYITGQTQRSRQAIANLQRICQEDLNGRYEMTVIDVLERPQLAEDEKILATPTVVRELPPPIRRIIGDLSDTEKVLLGLDLHPVSEKGSLTP